jgi:hypothetical protein
MPLIQKTTNEFAPNQRMYSALSVCGSYKALTQQQQPRHATTNFTVDPSSCSNLVLRDVAAVCREVTLAHEVESNIQGSTMCICKMTSQEDHLPAAHSIASQQTVFSMSHTLETESNTDASEATDADGISTSSSRSRGYRSPWWFLCCFQIVGCILRG